MNKTDQVLIQDFEWERGPGTGARFFSFKVKMSDLSALIIQEYDVPMELTFEPVLYSEEHYWVGLYIGKQLILKRKVPVRVCPNDTELHEDN